MQFRCYRCACVFSNGLPPMEALSRGQADAVGVEYEGDPVLLLEGTIYEGLSVHNLCTFCLQAVVSFKTLYIKGQCRMGISVRFSLPRMISQSVEDKYEHGSRNKVDYSSSVICNDCGHTETSRDWKYLNRWMQLHAVQDAFPNADITQLKELMDCVS